MFYKGINNLARRKEGEESFVVSEVYLDPGFGRGSNGYTVSGLSVLPVAAVVQYWPSYGNRRRL